MERLVVGERFSCDRVCVRDYGRELDVVLAQRSLRTLGTFMCYSLKELRTLDRRAILGVCWEEHGSAGSGAVVSVNVKPKLQENWSWNRGQPNR